MKIRLITVFLVSTGCLTAPTAEMPLADDEGLQTEDGTPPPDPDSDEGPEPDSDGVFVPEVADLPSGPECEQLGSDECGPGFKCTIARIDDTDELTTVCAALVDEPVEAGSLCELGDEPGEDQCGADAVCWDVMGDGMGTCLRFCNDVEQWDEALAQCGEGFTCNTWKSFPTDDGLCTPICHPLAGECPGTCGCFWAGNEFLCVPLTQNIPTGEPCGFVNDCAMDNFCMDAAVVPNCQGSACCAAFCDLGTGSCEQPGTECTAFFEEGMAPPGFEYLGMCILPS
jgi:hypothetical protein